MSLPNDIYVRYHSFESCEEFKASIVSRKPHKIDIGAVFSAPVSNYRSYTGLIVITGPIQG